MYLVCVAAMFIGARGDQKPLTVLGSTVTPAECAILGYPARPTTHGKSVFGIDSNARVIKLQLVLSYIFLVKRSVGRRIPGVSIAPSQCCRGGEVNGQ